MIGASTMELIEKIKVQSWGNSGAARLSKKLLNALDVEKGDELEVHVIDGVATLKKVEQKSALELLENYDGYYAPESDELALWQNTSPVGEEL